MCQDSPPGEVLFAFYLLSQFQATQVRDQAKDASASAFKPASTSIVYVSSDLYRADALAGLNHSHLAVSSYKCNNHMPLRLLLCDSHKTPTVFVMQCTQCLYADSPLGIQDMGHSTLTCQETRLSLEYNPNIQIQAWKMTTCMTTHMQNISNVRRDIRQAQASN
jgi:hypothetical protein